MISRALTSYIHDIIRSYKEVDPEYYSLFVDELPLHDKKIFLSHIVSAEDYELFCSNESGVNALVIENKKYMQSLIDNEIDQVHTEDKADLIDYHSMDWRLAS
ncbi:MAG TPA: hypothetical protein VKR58_09970 [Aquella sp.]|nr:hypothetical protein [Aquella sp.]